MAIILLDNILKKLIQENNSDNTNNNSIVQISKNNPTFLGHVVLTGCSLSIVGIGYLGLLFTGLYLEKQWLTEIGSDPAQQSQMQLQKIQVFDKPNSPEENKQQIRLVQQLNTINAFTIKHRKIMAFFYKQYFISLSIGSTAALISLFCVFFVSKEGWSKTNNALINICITSLGVTLFFLNSSQIFQQAENLKASQNLYNSYVALNNEFLSSLAAKRLLANANVKNLEGYIPIIQYTDSRLKDLSLIRLGFDPTSIVETKNRVDSILGVGNANSSTLPTKPPETSPSK